MNNGKIFWGCFFVTIGILILSVRFAWFSVEWISFGDYWPLLIILLGIAIIFKNKFVKGTVSSFAGVFLGLLLFGGVNNLIGISNFHYQYENDSSSASYQHYEKEYSDDIEFAKLKIEAGIGNIRLASPTSRLIEGDLFGTASDYSFYTTQKENKAFATFSLEKQSVNLLKDDWHSKLILKLNQKPVWDIKCELGAAKAYFDLSRYKVAKFKLETGATATKLVFGDKQEFCDINVEMGAAKLIIQIPKGAGLQLTTETFLVKKDLPDKIIDKSGGLYETENFANAETKFSINVQGGISSLTIGTY